MYQYFIKVVPTVYKQLSGEVSYIWYPIPPVQHQAGWPWKWVKHSKGAAVLCTCTPPHPHPLTSSAGGMGDVKVSYFLGILTHGFLSVAHTASNHKLDSRKAWEWGMKLLDYGINIYINSLPTPPHTHTHTHTHVATENSPVFCH